MKTSEPKDETVDTVTMDRREFLQTGLMATALAAAGRLPLLSAQTDAGSGIDASTGPYALKPIRDHLTRFSPVRTTPPTRGQYSLLYDVIHWNWVKGRRGTFANTVIGQIAIQRNQSDDRITYGVKQRMLIGGVNNVLDAQIICHPDDLNSLQRWQIRSYQAGPRGEIDPVSELSEKGSCTGGRINIDSGSFRYGFDAERPVVTQWTLLDVVSQKASPAWKVTFDLLQDLSLFKPNQSLVYDGETRVKLQGGQMVTLQTYAQTGRGILPIHYLLDADKRPQLVTSSILSWALSAQQNTT